ncbi:hypothetical protein GGS23DRAFT_588344 [Durotheca rogersii]|uniref:uncharacterized protein n=1 Tax=Durotheca rogersii TaxID=419775 RepID=UPI0022200A2D|nr:uncharacterized protein GGS23DRAFT_588344 [Durotheca rogersii]KAI5857293.1 hypothetical protein GGS23DRAFT_588344 [Durotheca rogersii]
MGQGSKRKLSLPSTILTQLETQQSFHSPGNARPRRLLPRKEQRKALRVQRRQSCKPRPSPKSPLYPPPTITSLRSTPPRSDDDLDDDNYIRYQLSARPEPGRYHSHQRDNTRGTPVDEAPDGPQASKSVRQRLVQDYAEIDDLERKLGLRGRKSLPKSFHDDGLVSLLDGLVSNEGDARVGSKRKYEVEADEWLAEKRQKGRDAIFTLIPNGNVDDDKDNNTNADAWGNGNDSRGDHAIPSNGSLFDLEGKFRLPDFTSTSTQDLGNGALSESGAGEGKIDSNQRGRENPYVAPTVGVAKYLPPSLRKPSGPSNETETQLRKRIQGLINRLTDDNMVGIIIDIQALYNTHPRQTVTSVVVHLILALVCSPEKRPDSFFTMISGFVAATHKVTGMAASAYFIEQLVQIFGRHYSQAPSDQSDPYSKHLISLVAELYNMQVVGCNLVFDYIRLFLSRLSELDTELLLRVVQLCGPSLRHEDPRSLGDIMNTIKVSGLGNTSARIDFMVNEIRTLQNNKAKAITRNRNLVDQRTQLRKRIGTLSGHQQVQPFRMGLRDIQDAHKHGKWWLVGASWSGGYDGAKGRSGVTDQTNTADIDKGLRAGDESLGIPDLWQLAREQGFNTEIRQRIFVALHAATDYENAELLIRNLRLNKHQRKEIPEIIVRSGERQSCYNHYYTLVASRFSRDRELSFQFRRCLIIRLSKMEEDIDNKDRDDLDPDSGIAYDMRWVYNTAKLYGSLVGSRCLRLADVVKYRNLTMLQGNAHVFFEILLISVLQECKGGFPEVFGGLDADEARGVQYFLRENVRQSDLLKSKRERKMVNESCTNAEKVLDEILTTETFK